MKKIIMATTTALLLYSTPSYAGPMSAIEDATRDLKFGVGVGLIDISGSSNSGTFFYAIAEKELDIYIGDTTSSAQVRLGRSTSATSTLNTLHIQNSINYMISGLFKNSLEIDDGISAYGLFGLSYASYDTTTSGAFIFSKTSSTLNLSSGIGVDYEVNDELKVAAEYTAYISNATAFSVNAYYSF